MAFVYLNIGSNLGNRKKLIEKAIEAITERFALCCRSEFVESQPWGYDSTNPFLNIGVSFQSDLHPEELLRRVKEIEKEISLGNHRDSDGRYCDREIDIDIMAIDEITYHSDRLTIPHIHLLDREFFINPLKELNPDWKYPE